VAASRRWKGDGGPSTRLKALLVRAFFLRPMMPVVRDGVNLKSKSDSPSPSSPSSGKLMCTELWVLKLIRKLRWTASRWSSNKRKGGKAREALPGSRP
jgi:hypothetical protein